MFIVAFGFSQMAPSPYMVDSYLAWFWFFDSVKRGDSITVTEARSTLSTAIPYVSFHPSTGIVWGSR